VDLDPSKLPQAALRKPGWRRFLIELKPSGTRGGGTQEIHQLTRHELDFDSRPRREGSAFGS
jgi:hypothetical protein